MGVLLIDAETTDLNDIIKDVGSSDSSQTYVIYHLNSDGLSFLEKEVSEIDGYSFKLIENREFLRLSRVYGIPSDHNFFYDGVQVKVTEKTGIKYPRPLENAIYIFDVDLTILYLSVPYKKNPELFIGKPLSHVLPKQALDKVRGVLGDLSVGLSESFLEWDGGVSKEYRLTLLKSGDTGKNHYVLIGADVTERQRMEQAYYEMEAKYEYMTLTSREVVGIHSIDGYFKEVSPTSTEILGYTPKELIGQDPSQFFHPDDVDRVRQASLKLIFEGIESRNFQYRFKHKDGHYIWLEAFTDCIRDDDGHILMLLSGSRDISQLKEIEIQLRESHERFRGIADNMPGVIYLCKNDETFSMIYLNNEVEDLTGYKVEDFTDGRVSFVDLYHPNDKDDIFRQVDEALEVKKPFRLSYRLRSKHEKGWKWVEEYGQGIYKDGQLELLEGVILDVTERKETELKLSESDRRFRGIADNMPGVVYLCNNDETYSMLWLNQEIENLTGYSREEFLDDSINMTALYHPDDREYIFQGFDEAIAAKKPFHLTYRIKSKYRNDWVWVDEYGQGIFEKGKLKTVEGVILDITNKKEAELEILQRQANMRAILSSTESLIALFDTDMRVMEANDSLINYFLNYFDVDVRGKLVTELKFDTRGAFVPKLEAALKGESSRFDWHLVRGGMDYYFQFRVNPVKINQEIIGASMMAENIYELKKAQEELQRHNETLERTVAERTKELKHNNVQLMQSNRELAEALDSLKKTQTRLIQAEKMASLGVLAAGVGHEINNPLNFIQNGAYGLMQELQDDGVFDEERYKPLLDIIYDGVQRASNIVKSLSHFSRQVKTTDEKCDVHDIIENCLLILQSKLKGRVSVIRQFCGETPIVIGNAGRMHQAFLNMLSNAEQAIGDTGSIIIKTICTEQYVKVSFKDNGEGIPTENLNRLGDPFFTTKDPGEGTGLGLFITFSIIQELNGEIEVNSELGKGTEFIITFVKESG